MDGVPFCFGFHDGDVHQNERGWVPCYAKGNVTDHVPCCLIGDYCLEDNLCRAGNYQNSDVFPQGGRYSPFYVAACTDPKRQDPSCSHHCERVQNQQVVYQSNGSELQCCSNATTIDCQDPPNSESWPNEDPENVPSITSLAGYFPPAITDNVKSLGEAYVSDALYRPSIFSQEHATFTPSYWDAIHVVYRSDFISGKPTAAADIYTGPAPWSGIATATSKPTLGGSSTPVPTSRATSKAKIIAPAVIVPIVVILLASILGFWLSRRRRRQRQAIQDSPRRDDDAFFDMPEKTRTEEVYELPDNSRLSELPANDEIEGLMKSSHPPTKSRWDPEH